MTFIERLELLDRFISFIQREGTGTPKQIAGRLGVSERTVHNLLCDLKQMGFDIGYCKHKPSYYFKIEKQVNFFPVEVKNDTESVKGGKNILLFDRLHDWCSGEPYL